MDTERWQILLKAIDRGSLRAAAEEMGFTVSGISRSVATLEKELGFALLHRAKSGVQPTAECRQLLPSVRELPKNHPLADRESFPVESLKTEPFIDSYPGMETDITLIFDKLKARPDARYSTMDITATYAMVSAGLGISVHNAINHPDG